MMSRVHASSALFAPRPPSMQAYMVTCAARAAVRERALASFRATDWQGDMWLEIDEEAAVDHLARIHATWLKVLSRVATGAADVALVVEDDVGFNRYLGHNLQAWAPLCSAHGDRPFFGSLYNPDRPARWRPEEGNFFIADPRAVWGAQAVLMSRSTATYFLRHWAEESGAADVRMPRLTSRLAPVYLHAPSLVQHLGDASTWEGPFHQARDFDPDWRSHARP